MRAQPIIVGCQDRTGYLSWDKADRAMRRSRFRDRNGRGRVNVYRCRHCSYWHIGRAA